MRTTRLWVTGTIAALALTSCGGDSDPLAEDSEGDAAQGDALVIGSQQYYSNTIIAELYAQVLESEDIEVDRQFDIGQREVYVSELESGAIDIFPEYAGNFLQYYEESSEAASLEEITAQLEEVLPDGLRVLEAAEATDQDSFVVTAEFAEENDLSEVGDLAGLEDLQIAANAEFEARPYGPEGLQDVYGVEITLVPVEAGGGALTVDALRDGDVEVADIYSADPELASDDLVVLEDPEELVLPQNVIPVVSDRVDEEAAALINEVNAALTPDELIALNGQSVDEQADPADVASEWLAEQGLD
ncbi:ABC transporter substrate-binding protein [Nesterenkonia halotolerans]|uniref:Osmoprotectant transport system substrate-binding protein n=1 Tax=Nesterenkonia halotolerans TaxID=225325 RepID=A0ABR9J5V1_9MICC|nr:ABC transporter substrate-binding protein [Nesterenkonia halotolerans]MBE1514344.1 osmoprotectant transport system substrate-binding protein [Nesterenkonia halotolerans]